MFTSDMKLKNETVIGACFTHFSLGSWLRNFYYIMYVYVCSNVGISLCDDLG